MAQLVEYSRTGLDFASMASSAAFGAVKSGTRLGFAVTRGIATTAVGITTTIVDHTLFGGSTVARPVVGGAVSSMISLAEQLTLAPIFIGEYITSTSLIAAHSSINVLSIFFPGSSEASFSLASFINLVKREWHDPPEGHSLPEKQFGITQVARAIVAWVALQGVTQQWQERAWFKHLKEIHVRDHPRNFDSWRARRGSRVRVTSDVTYPGDYGHIIAADIGEAPTRAQSVFLHVHKFATVRSKAPGLADSPRPPPRMSNNELKSTLRRLSKLVLAGYGGASLLFFGVPLTSQSAPPPVSSPQAKQEEAQLANAINAAEAEADAEAPPGAAMDPPPAFSWWDVLLGKHDHEIIQSYASSPQTIRGNPTVKPTNTTDKKVDVRIGSEHLMPRFWVLTDHGRGQVVLVLRGTMSLNEIAVDLTCEPEEFTPAAPSPSEEEDDYPHTDDSPLPGRFIFPTDTTTSNSTRPHIPSFNANLPNSNRKGKAPESISPPKYEVHSGMLRMAKAMGDIGRPVQVAVREALHHNLEYDLVLAGHSLGAGVAALLGLMWADPATCLTVRASGLPVGRRVSVYCFAPPALTSAPLSRLSSSLIVSFVYSHDVVSRLSLGSVRDLKNASMWLCEEESRKTKKNKDDNAGYVNVTARARRWKDDEGRIGDEHWFIAIRKTLEANMHASNMFPPGRVLWAMRDSDLHPLHRSSPAKPSPEANAPDKLRLFEVLDVEKVFGQIVFARDMLGAHMPHKYDSVLHDLL